MEASLIGFVDGRLVVPDNPELVALPGDGIGPEVYEATCPAIAAAVEASYGGRRAITWRVLPIGQAAVAQGLDPLPEGTVEAVRRHRVALKGPTMTPTGGGHRSINVRLRQALDLFRSVRPVRYFEGVKSPVRNPHALNVVIYRENTEDVYAGIEFAQGTPEATELGDWLRARNFDVPDDAGLGIKVISKARSQRLVRAAVRYAVDRRLRRVTLVHKGNIMKATEGAFLRWGQEVVRQEFAGQAVVASDLKGAPVPEGVVLVDDRIADAMFQDLILTPSKFDVIATTNINGDYISDAAAAQVGGLGVAPGANVGEGIAVFEPTHGTAPDIAGKGVANPGSMILTAVMLLEHIGWDEASRLLMMAFAAVLASGRMTGDLALGRPGIQVLSTSGFGDAVAAEVRRLAALTAG
ncbi:MAG TPA: NADP-dependent isocitrate dehydrogenase [Myxococcota bacterium]|nr:NADP-dependent isocitrate dehydrogenase [Myxococcota bacterium]